MKDYIRESGNLRADKLSHYTPIAGVREMLTRLNTITSRYRFALMRNRTAKYIQTENCADTHNSPLTSNFPRNDPLMDSSWPIDRLESFQRLAWNSTPEILWFRLDLILSQFRDFILKRLIKPLINGAFRKFVNNRFPFMIQIIGDIITFQDYLL